MTKTTTEPQRIDHQRAMATYLAMGPARSLSKLCHHYAGTVPNPPGLPTLKFWSKRDGWRRAASEHDIRVAQKLEAKAEQAAVVKRFDQIAEFTAIIEEGAQALKDFIADPQNLEKIKNAAEFSAVSNALVRLSQLVELLQGGPTGRLATEYRAEPPEWMRARLEESRPAFDEHAGQVTDHEPADRKQLN